MKNIVLHGGSRKDNFDSTPFVVAVLETYSWPNEANKNDAYVSIPVTPLVVGAQEPKTRQARTYEKAIPDLQFRDVVDRLKETAGVGDTK